MSVLYRCFWFVWMVFCKLHSIFFLIFSRFSFPLFLVYDLSHLINKKVCAFSVSLRHSTPTLRHIPVGVCWLWLVDGLLAVASAALVPATSPATWPPFSSSAPSSSSSSLSDSSTVIWKQTSHDTLTNTWSATTDSSNCQPVSVRFQAGLMLFSTTD